MLAQLTENKTLFIILVTTGLAALRWAIDMWLGMRKGLELQKELLQQLASLNSIRHFEQLQQGALQLATLDPTSSPEEWQAARVMVLRAVENAARDRLGLKDVVPTDPSPEAIAVSD